MSWTAELPREVDAGEEVGRLHADLNLLLLHIRIMDALQNSLHVLFQLGSLQHQPPPAVNLGDGRLILKTTYQCIRLGAVGIIHPEHAEVGGVITVTADTFSPVTRVHVAKFPYLGAGALR